MKYQVKRIQKQHQKKFGEKIYKQNEYENFKEYYELNKQNIRKKIINDEYIPEIVKLQEIANYKGKRRLVAKLDIKDKFLTRAITQILEKYINTQLSEKSFAYKKGKGTIDEIKMIKKYVEDGNTIVCQIDIKDYFNNINHNKLLNELKKYNIENIVIKLIEKYLKCEIEHELVTSIKNKGILQGNPISPVLSNIYLDTLDKKLENQQIKFVRYCDDINIFGKTRQEVIDKKQMIERELKENYYLELNNNKTNISSVFKTSFLGYTLIKEKNNIEILKKERTRLKYYNFWKQSSLKQENNEYHIINDGILNQKDYSILFENKDKKVYIPIENAKSLNIYSNVILNTNFFNIMNNKNIIVNIFDKNSRYIGKFVPQNTRKSSITVLKQVEIYNNPQKRLEMAKNIIKAGIYNLKSNLKYYDRRYHIEIKNKIEKIEKLEKEIMTAKNHTELLLTEARIRELYYSCFNEILNDKRFEFLKRTKRPPKDNLNCLISFGNTLLYNYIAKEIYKTTLDIRIGYLHSSNNRYESLNLDLADIFKPIIVDKVIFKIINKKIINPKLHFEKRDNGVFLNEIGKRIIIEEFYSKMLDSLKINDMRMSYDMIIRKEIYKLLNSIRYDVKYKAFKYYQYEYYFSI